MKSSTNLLRDSLKKYEIRIDEKEILDIQKKLVQNSLHDKLLKILTDEEIKETFKSLKIPVGIALCVIKFSQSLVEPLPTPKKHFTGRFDFSPNRKSPKKNFKIKKNDRVMSFSPSSFGKVKKKKKYKRNRPKANRDNKNERIEYYSYSKTRKYGKRKYVKWKPLKT